MIEIELIVGTMGLDKILSDKLPRYSEALLKRASSTLASFRNGAKEFAEMNSPGALPDEEYGLERYTEISQKLLEDQEIAEAAEGLESWPDELQMEIMVLIADIKAYLSAQLPQNLVTGSLSGTDVPPSDSDQFRFLWQANLVDDIRKFVGLLNAGAITPLESALMRTLFPQTHDYLLIEVMDQVMQAALDKNLDTWEGGWRKPALSGFLGVPIMSFSDVMQAQTGMAEKTAGRPKEPGAVQIAGLNTTNSQAIDAKTIDQSKI